MIVSQYLTRSYWRHALLRKAAFGDFLAALGFASLIVGLLDTFRLVPKETLPSWLFYACLAGAVGYVFVNRRPIKRITFKPPQRDLCFEVRFGDLLDSKEDIVISTNTTFETAISGGPISPKSLQGQVLLRFFDGNADDLDRQLKGSLNGVPAAEAGGAGRRKRYPIGTTARVKAHGKNFYFVAMANLNEHGNAQSSLAEVSDALTGLWSYVASQGEFADLAIPLIGTGRGRVRMSQQKMIELIAQSFADAAQQKTFSRKLSIVVHPTDAREHEINLFQVRDDLGRRLSV